MSRPIQVTIVFAVMFFLCGWQQPAGKPNFSGAWRLDSAKSKTENKDDLVWTISHKGGEFATEEVSAGKTLSSSKCVIGKSCEFDQDGKKMTAMTYFFDTTLVQIRSAADNSSVIKRQLKMNDDGSLRVELITIVPSDKTETLVFGKQVAAADPPKQ
jgi:hypothetical protein